MKKIIFFDVDGTIISQTLEIPDSTVKAIREIRNNGNIAVLFTGRPYSHIDKKVLDIGFDSCICTMGAFIMIGSDVFEDMKPEPGNARYLFELARSCKLDMVFERADGAVFDKSEELSPFMQNLRRIFLYKGLCSPSDIYETEFTFEKMCIWTRNDSRLEEFEAGAGKYLDLVGKKENMEEWVAKGVSVQRSVNKVLGYFKVKKENSYGIGDSINDFPMLECTGHIAAMGDGSDLLKKKADFVTDSLLNDGLEKAMKHFQLI